MTGAEPTPRRRLVEAAAPAAIAAWFLGVALLGVASTYAPSDLAWTALAYLALAVALHQGALLLRDARLPGGGGVGATLLALVLVWQLRELTRIPTSLAWTVVVAAVLAWPVFRILIRPTPRSGWRRRLAVTGAAGLATGFVLLAGAASSETFRWHLLRHDTLIGTPFFYLFEPSVEAVHRHLVERAPSVAPPAPGDGPEAQGPEEAARGPHVVFVLLDTLRADALAAWGGDPDLMPALNRRLEAAVRLTDVQANASWTRPSMGSYFTGLLPEEHGAIGVDDALADGFETLAENLHARGYRTVAFTTNIAATGRAAGFAQGFDTFVELAGEPYARAERVRRAVTTWLEHPDFDAAAPVFLYLHFLDPHEPYLAGEAPERERPEPYRSAYRRELAYLDRELEAVLERVDAALVGPKIVVVASDHGEEFFEHELFGHGQSLYDEVLHVPIAIARPGSEGRSVAAPLEARDLRALLLRLVEEPGAKITEWAAAHARDRRYASLDYSTTGRLVLRPYLARVVMQSVREGDEKLVWSAYGDTRELYDLGEDPAETRNLLLERPERAAALTRALEEAVTTRVERTPVAASDAAREQLKALGYVD